MFDNLDDPRQQMLMAMGLGLLGNQSGNFGKDVGQAGLLGMNAYNTGQQRKAKLAQEKQQEELRAMQMAQMKKAQEDQAYASQIAPQYFNPGAPAPQFNDALGDGTQGPVGPATPPKQDFAGYGAALAGRNPQMAMPFIQAGMKQAPQYKEVAGRLVQIGPEGVKEAYAPPEKPKHQPGDTREIKSGRRIITQQFDGNDWKTAFTSDMDRPDKEGVGPPKPQFGWEYTPEGEIKYVKGGPHDPKVVAKVDAGSIAKNDARARVDTMLNKIEGYYTELNKDGSAISTALPMRSNIANRLAASDGGQLLSGAMGTRSQSIRNNIRQSIPLLMNEIRSATGMSAKAMDSNAELQFYLRAATDPTMDIEANMRAINALREIYGSGSMKSGKSGQDDPLGLREK